MSHTFSSSSSSLTSLSSRGNLVLAMPYKFNNRLLGLSSSARTLSDNEARARRESQMTHGNYVMKVAGRKSNKKKKSILKSSLFTNPRKATFIRELEMASVSHSLGREKWWKRSEQKDKRRESAIIKAGSSELWKCLTSLPLLITLSSHPRRYRSHSVARHRNDIINSKSLYVSEAHGKPEKQSSRAREREKSDQDKSEFYLKKFNSLHLLFIKMFISIVFRLAAAVLLSVAF